MHILPLSLWLLVTAQIEAAEAAQQQQQLLPLLPTAIKKMTPDQGEKFYHEYCAFPAEDADFALAPQIPPQVPPAGPIMKEAEARRISEDEQDARRLFTNASASLSYRSPFAPHQQLHQLDYLPSSINEKRHNIFRRAAEALATLLKKRDWACPTGTASCAAIGYPNSCCQTSETCVKIPDTGLGPVGCCPSGATCGGSVSGCAAGNTACGANIGGGCCIPGFVCEGVGCVKSSTITTIPPSTTSTSITIAPPPPLPTPPTTSTTPTTTPTPTTPTQSPTTPTGTTTTTSTDGDIIPPIRPTSSLPSGINTFCPTGFYACKASAGGGCCQTGRDCQTTSCPPISMTTILTTNGITVVVPATDLPAAKGTGTCAGGWFMCDKDAGGPIPGCCPSGYSCGTASCSVVNAGGATATVAKELPSQGGAAAAGPGVVGAVGRGLGLVVILLGWFM
ncbi:hypothetical protein B0H66DRAFT_133602 [Apodospora peruviana]|uniref:GPI anchored protein n=1 Tax=Apodospora peruviana TaxID=516989 RepID=A0AAE0IID5_9PEZI|nr:hypothetical protein B0H66DRAFT_133602 [Apodospora peruviana]